MRDYVQRFRREGEMGRAERKRIEEMRDNPRAFVENSVLSSLKQRFAGASLRDIEEMARKGSDARKEAIDSQISTLQAVITRCEEQTGETLHASFKTAGSQSELLKRVLDKYIKERQQEAKAEDDKRRELEAKRYRGETGEKDTLHFGDD